MNRKLYWKQKLPVMFLNFLCMVGLAVFLSATGNSFDSIFLILLIWIVILTVRLVVSYCSRKVQMEKLLNLAEQLEERYLLSEVMEKPEHADDLVYYRLLKLAGKSMLEQVNGVRRERTEYKEYVEQWVHEIKTPITAMKLLCENAHSQETKELLVELEKVNRYTEQALYYARSEHTEKDYSVREIRLFDVIHQSIAENKYLLLKNGVGIDLQETDDSVYSDEKWLCFILNQLIVNSVKYRTEQPVLKFYTERQGNQVILCVQDNGIGIDAGDLQRIFEKGFTGQNGRNALQNSTGIGLYLCRRLCDKLGIGICADSKGSGTILRLIFHINDFIERVQG
ncbi:MAG: HAMP domain-containing histidine kinase [Lachnospiraceae bacterium]|nr:HAMP domain-containing histidine kinase [Lachnospiraceae bacterium]